MVDWLISDNQEDRGCSIPHAPTKLIQDSKCLSCDTSLALYNGWHGTTSPPLSFEEDASYEVERVL